MALPIQPRHSILLELFRLFLKLGTIGFGGPAAHIAMIQDEVVIRRQWLTQQEFLDLLSATNFIPGPNSTELAIHIGHRMAGWRGLLVAGLSFIFPAVFIVSLLAWAYVKYGNLPALHWVMYGVKPVIIAVVLQAIFSLGTSAIKTKFLAFLGCVAFAMNALGVGELMTIFAVGLFALGHHLYRSKGVMSGLGAIPWAADAPLVGSSLALSSYSAMPVTQEKLFLFFLKVGSVLFGSGYVLLAFLKTELVDQWAWLTEGQLLDAIAVGQFTPGPLFTTATFIGYVISGPTGAALATLGIFLPAFVFVALSAPFVAKLRSSPTASVVLDGVNVASLAVMAVTTVYLARTSVTDVTTGILAVIAALVLLRYKLNSAWLVLAGGLVGVLVHFVQGS